MTRQFAEGAAEDLLKNLSDKRSNVHSWSQCYNCFDPANPHWSIDEAALRLAFYLASWGMYRGSAKIRDYGYVALNPICETLAESKWVKLRGISISSAVENNDIVFDLIDCLKENMAALLPDVTATDTLLTKIVLGASGCMMAYDRFLIGGLKHFSLNGRLSRKSQKDTLNFIVKSCDYSKFCNRVRSGVWSWLPDLRLADAYLNYVGRTVSLDETTLANGR